MFEGQLKIAYPALRPASRHSLALFRLAILVLYAVFLFVSGVLRCQAGEGRTFTDVNGRKITAEVVSATESTVTFSIKGKEIPYPISKLSEPDQKYIQSWLDLHPAATDAKVTLVATKKREDRVKTRAADKEVEREDWIYDVTVSNKSSDSLMALELRSRIYFWNAQVGGDKQQLEVAASVLEIIELSGGNKKSSYKVGPVSIYTTILDGSYADGSSPKKEDKLEGIWLRLYQGEKMLGEFKDETATMKKEKWPEEEKK